MHWVSTEEECVCFSSLLDVFSTSCFSLSPPDLHKLSHSRDHNTHLAFLLSATFLGSKQQKKEFVKWSPKGIYYKFSGRVTESPGISGGLEQGQLLADITSPGNCILWPLPTPEWLSQTPDSWHILDRCLVLSPGHQAVGLQCSTDEWLTWL